MTQEKDYLDLADRVEAAKGPDRELDLRVAMAVLPGWDYPLDDAAVAFHTKYGGQPAYTASLDAAMTLVPEGARIAALAQEIGTPRWLVKLGNADRPGGLPTCAGATPALALTAACLRAHASRVGDRRGGE